MVKKILLAFFILITAYSLSGCIKLGKDEQAAANPGGVFVSGDKGETWIRKVDLMTAGAQPGLIGENGDVDVVNFTFDPSDSSIVYMGTVEKGLFYSYNNGKGWFHDDSVNKGFVRGIAVDPKDQCTVYAAVNTRLMKTTTCNRSWDEAYKVPIGQVITAVAVDYYNPDIVYIGLGTGDFLKSTDKGKNWERIKNFPSRVNKIVLDKDDSRHIYVGTEKSYFYRSLDAGESWENSKEAMEDFDDSKRAIEIVQDQQSGDLYYATGFGILRSKDKGVSWEEVKLLTTPSKTDIFSMAINPQNGNELYYATNTNIYRTLDRGTTWSTWRIPTKRTGRAMAVHPKDDNVIYLGVRLYEQ